MTGPTSQWSAIGDYVPALAEAAAVSVLLSAFTIAAGTVLGTCVGTALASRSTPARAMGWVAAAPLMAFRVLPALVLLVWLHFAVPQSSGWLQEVFAWLASIVAPNAGASETTILQGVSSRPFATAVLGLTFVLGGGVAMIVRDGIRGIPPALIDAAKSQGMGTVLRIRRVIAPETFRSSLAPLLRSYLAIIRLTTLAAFIGCNELVLVAFTAGRESSHERELLTVVALGYLALLLPLTAVVLYVERSRWLSRRV